MWQKYIENILKKKADSSEKELTRPFKNCDLDAEDLFFINQYCDCKDECKQLEEYFKQKANDI